MRASCYFLRDLSARIHDGWCSRRCTALCTLLPLLPFSDVPIPTPTTMVCESRLVLAGISGVGRIVPCRAYNVGQVLGCAGPELPCPWQPSTRAWTSGLTPRRSTPSSPRFGSLSSPLHNINHLILTTGRITQSPRPRQTSSPFKN